MASAVDHLEKLEVSLKAERAKPRRETKVKQIGTQQGEEISLETQNGELRAELERVKNDNKTLQQLLSISLFDKNTNLGL